jgi:uncharacterized protein (TIGR02147 family)
MLLEHKEYRGYLKWVLADRIARNPSYSLRAFARQLGVHHSLLVQLFQNKKRLSVDRAHLIAHRLELHGKEYEYFCLLVEVENAKGIEQKAILLNRLQEISPRSEARDLGVEHFQMISEWYHLPILQMAGLAEFDFTPVIIAKRLGVSKIEAELAIERLERLELIEKDEAGKYRKTESRLLTTSAVPQDALRKFHKQMLLKAIDALGEQTPQEKWTGSETFAFDTRLLPEANQIIEQFFDRMVQLSYKGENRDHVYHLGTSFFRITQKLEGDSHEKRK